MLVKVYIGKLHFEVFQATSRCNCLRQGVPEWYHGREEGVFIVVCTGWKLLVFPAITSSTNCSWDQLSVRNHGLMYGKERR